MAKFSTLIVGAHFRPPAKQCLARSASGAQLILRLDDDNAYDPAAVQVLFDPAQIPESEYSTLESELIEAGVTLEELMSGGPIQLGFIPAQEGKPLAKARALYPDLLGNQQVRELMAEHGEALQCKLDFLPDGSPKAQIVVEG